MSETFGLDAKPINPFDLALEMEGVSGPVADLARSIYQQESGGGRNTKTSNAGAVGGMQIIPKTFQSVADKGWDIADPIHNARAGLRYVKQLHEATNGDPRLTAIGYYGGPNAINQARQGNPVYDPRNPQAPSTFQYAQQVLSRLAPVGDMIPAANAAPVQEEFGLDAQPAGEDFGLDAKPVASLPEVSSNPLVGFAAGLGHGVGEVAMGAQHYLGKGLQGLGVDQAGQWLVDDAKQGRERMAQEIAPYKEVSPYATGGGEIGGNIAATWPVGGLLGKAVSAVAPVVGRVAPSAVPYAEKLANALATGGFKVGGAAPATLAGKSGEMGIRILGGGATGGATAGLVNPDDAMTGAMIGAALPPVASGAYSLTKGLASGAKSLVEPFYQGGREKIVGRAIRNVAGNSADDAIRAMETSQSAIPGVNYSAAEAANNPGIASLSRTATATDPVAMNELAQQTAANNAARIEALTGLAPDKAAAIEGRTSATEALYGAAKDKVVQITDNLKELLDRPSIKTAISKAQQLARENNEGTQFVKSIPEQMGMIVGENGKPLTVSAEQTGSMTGRAAHYIKMALDDMANASPMSGIGKNEVRSIANTRNAFLQEIEQQIPEYAQARKLFAELSAPVTQADMVEKIAERAVNPRGNLTLGGLSRALSDRTAKTVTGQQNATLAKVLAPEQLQTLRQIEADLLRQDFANTAGRGAGSDTVQKLAFTNMLNQAGIPQALRGSAVPSIIGNLLQRGGDAFYGGANKKIAELLAQSLVDPRQSAALARGSMTTPAMQKLINSLQSPAQLMYRAAPVMSAQ